MSNYRHHTPEHCCVRCAFRQAWFHCGEERVCAGCLTPQERADIDQQRREAAEAKQGERDED